jgi:hypothetical protein
MGTTDITAMRMMIELGDELSMKRALLYRVWMSHSHQRHVICYVAILERRHLENRFWNKVAVLCPIMGPQMYSNESCNDSDVAMTR